MLVTPHISLTGETFRPTTDQISPNPDPEKVLWFVRPVTKFQTIGFCDWVSIYQDHEADLPVLCNGAIQRIDADGSLKNTTYVKTRIEGSFESSVFVSCNGHRVTFEGNVSKFGRLDNVWGYTFTQCLDRINAIVTSLGLPPFSPGSRYVTNVKGEPRTVWTGARVTRLDITQNFATGSKENAYHFMNWLNGQQASRLKTGTYGEGETVDFGRGSRNVYSKAYLKGPELRRHAAKAYAFDQSYLEQLAEWCDSVGLVRWETTYKSTLLHTFRCNYLGGLDMRQIELDFTERQSVLTRGSAEVEDLAALAKPLLSTLRMWQSGDDLTVKLSRATFYRHRRELLPYGVDIAIKSNITKFVPRTRVIQLGPVARPDWYELPSYLELKNGTTG